MLARFQPYKMTRETKDQKRETKDQRPERPKRDKRPETKYQIPEKRERPEIETITKVNLLHSIQRRCETFFKLRLVHRL